MRIQHNISALNSHRNLGINNSATSKNLEKLSSGYRINRAGDDAAGLAISEKMRGQIRGLSMAEQNTSNGINLIQTAEGGLNETHAILQRMRELAVQSSNGTYQDEDREQIALEYDALKSEIDRIASSTHYNGIKLLDGTTGGVKLAHASQLDNDAVVAADAEYLKLLEAYNNGPASDPTTKAGYEAALKAWEAASMPTAYDVELGDVFTATQTMTSMGSGLKSSWDWTYTQGAVVAGDYQLKDNVTNASTDDYATGVGTKLGFTGLDDDKVVLIENKGVAGAGEIAGLSAITLRFELNKDGQGWTIHDDSGQFENSSITAGTTDISFKLKLKADPSKVLDVSVAGVQFNGINPLNFDMSSGNVPTLELQFAADHVNLDGGDDNTSAVAAVNFEEAGVHAKSPALKLPEELKFDFTMAEDGTWNVGVDAEMQALLDQLDLVLSTTTWTQDTDAITLFKKGQEDIDDYKVTVNFRDPTKGVAGDFLLDSDEIGAGAKFSVTADTRTDDWTVFKDSTSVTGEKYSVFHDVKTATGTIKTADVFNALNYLIAKGANVTSEKNYEFATHLLSKNADLSSPTPATKTAQVAADMGFNVASNFATKVIVTNNTSTAIAANSLTNLEFTYNYQNDTMTVVDKSGKFLNGVLEKGKAIFTMQSVANPSETIEVNLGANWTGIADLSEWDKDYGIKFQLNVAGVAATAGNGSGTSGPTLVSMGVQAKSVTPKLPNEADFTLTYGADGKWAISSDSDLGDFEIYSGSWDHNPDNIVLVRKGLNDDDKKLAANQVIINFDGEFKNVLPENLGAGSEFTITVDLNAANRVNIDLANKKQITDVDGYNTVSTPGPGAKPTDPKLDLPSAVYGDYTTSDTLEAKRADAMLASMGLDGGSTIQLMAKFAETYNESDAYILTREITPDRLGGQNFETLLQIGDETFRGTLKDGALSFKNVAGETVAVLSNAEEAVATGSISFNFAPAEKGLVGQPELLVRKEGAIIGADGNSELVFQIGANGAADQRVGMYVLNMSTNNLGNHAKGNFVSESSIDTIDSANLAVNTLDSAINYVSAQRANLGALQNRLEHTLNNLGVTKENLTAAESTIRDVDMAAEMMEFTKNNILVQAAQAMLAQANQLPQGVLQLLR